MAAHLNRRIFSSLGSLLVLLLVLIGCNKEGDVAQKDASKPAAQVQNKDNAGKPLQAQPVALSKEVKPAPFEEAVLLDPPNADEMIPPNITCNRKNSGKIFEAIKNELWNKVVFNQNGKKVRYQAILTTDLGAMNLELFGDIAPNHVRNFVCLAKSGYYDGMTFYRSLNTKVEDNTAAYIETGCPRGTGERWSGSIGYWLKPEIDEKATHEEGTLGAYVDPEDPNTAACRFYIAGVKMPYMDGNFTIFGKVATGLDVVRTINKRAVDNDDRPKEPVLIRSVTIQTTLE